MTPSRTWFAWPLALAAACGGGAGSDPRDADTGDAADAADPIGASTLAELADALAPGQWGVLTPAGKETIGGGLTTSYSDSAGWDPVNQRLMYVGSDHGVGYDHLIWSAADNRWSDGSAFPAIPLSTLFVGHAFDGNAADPTTGDFYYRLRDDTPGAGGTDVFKYRAATSSWTPLPDNPLETNEGGACCSGVAFFPQLDGGSLVWVTPVGEVYACRAPCAAVGDWRLVEALGESFGSWGFVEYNPSRQLVLFGSGDNQHLYQLTSDGTITRLADLPVSIYDGTGFSGHVTADPVSGAFVIIEAGTDHRCHTYQIETETWGSCTDPPAEMAGSNAAAPIASHGVIAYVHCGEVSGVCDGDIYLYKHSE